MFVSPPPPNSYVEILIPNVMVQEGHLGGDNVIRMEPS